MDNFNSAAISKKFKKSVLAIGNFDGVHLGHQKVFSQSKKLAIKEKRKFGKSQLESWLSIQRSHAIANGIYVAAVNRVGIEKQENKKIEFWGNSVIFDPSGNVVKKASLKENILICEIDFKKVETSRQHWPFFRDRRIDYYKGLLKNPRDA